MKEKIPRYVNDEKDKKESLFKPLTNEELRLYDMEAGRNALYTLKELFKKEEK